MIKVALQAFIVVQFSIFGFIAEAGPFSKDKPKAVTVCEEYLSLDSLLPKVETENALVVQESSSISEASSSEQGLDALKRIIDEESQKHGLSVQKSDELLKFLITTGIFAGRTHANLMLAEPVLVNRVKNLNELQIDKVPSRGELKKKFKPFVGSSDSAKSIRQARAEIMASAVLRSIGSDFQRRDIDPYAVKKILETLYEKSYESVATILVRSSRGGVYSFVSRMANDLNYRARVTWGALAGFWTLNLGYVGYVAANQFLDLHMPAEITQMLTMLPGLTVPLTLMGMTLLPYLAEPTRKLMSMSQTEYLDQLMKRMKNTDDLLVIEEQLSRFSLKQFGLNKIKESSALDVRFEYYANSPGSYLLSVDTAKAIDSLIDHTESMSKMIHSTHNDKMLSGFEDLLQTAGWIYGEILEVERQNEVLSKYDIQELRLIIDALKIHVSHWQFDADYFLGELKKHLQTAEKIKKDSFADLSHDQQNRLETSIQSLRNRIASMENDISDKMSLLNEEVSSVQKATGIENDFFESE